MTKIYLQYKELRKKITDLHGALGLMSWDQEVNMPPAGQHFRAQQIATLSGIVHELSTSKEYVDLLNELSNSNSLDFKESRNVKESLRILDKQRKLPTDFVEHESRTISEAYQAWLKARSENKFSIFSAKLSEIVSIQREKAEFYSYTTHPYDSLLDDYEPGLTTETVKDLFQGVKPFLTELLNKINASSDKPDKSVLAHSFDITKQMQFCREVISDLGYNWNAGRLDFSVHPFSTSFSPLDARITTRVNENNLEDCIWSAIHETGHALYEQGLPVDEYGLPAGEPVSLGVHESQSRLWENCVGKSKEFIDAYWHSLVQFFPEAFKNTSAKDFYAAINIVEPNLIRINSDELTYHFHIMLRFEIEKELISGNYEATDLEDIWNQKISDYLGLKVPSPLQGVLQDIHWSHGSFGYFPTYSIGSFLSAQFFHKYTETFPSFRDQFLNRKYSSLLNWLRTNIHQHGRTYNLNELCEKVTGEQLNFKYFSDYLQKKYTEIYSL